MRFLRALYRLIMFATTSTWVLVKFAFYKWRNGQDINRGLEIRRKWLIFILKVLGVKYQIKGFPPSEPSMIVCNHRTYLDPMPILTQVHAFPVAKAEVEKWPLVGYGSSETGVLWVNRSDRDSRRKTREKMIDVIRKLHHHILIFPEGTTHTHPTTIEFRHGTFEVAAKEGIQVIPVAIDYLNPKDAWVGEDTFSRHFFECFGNPETHVMLWYGPPIQASDPGELLHTAQSWIDEHMLKIQQYWKEEKLQKQKRMS